MQNNHKKHIKQKGKAMFVGLLLLCIVIIYAVIKYDDMLQENVTESNEKNTSIQSPESLVATSGKYINYDDNQFALAETKKVALFFHASWCSTCKVMDADIKRNLSKIPENLVIMKADYDKNIDLKNKYSVNNQSTIIQIDKEGKKVGEWIGLTSLSELVDNLK